MQPDKQDAHGRETSAATPARPCPICGKLSVHQFRPFCSKRCADVDLHRWLGGVYAIPVAPEEDAGECSALDGGSSRDANG